MAEKNDGILIPKLVMTSKERSIQLSFTKAEIIPKNTPNKVAIVIAAKAKIIVFGSVSAIIVATDFPCF